MIVARSRRLSYPASAEHPLAAGRKLSQRSTPHRVFPGGGCMTCAGRLRQGCSASACASKSRGGVEPSERKPSRRSRDLSKARLGRGETRSTRRMVCAPSCRGGRQVACRKGVAIPIRRDLAEGTIRRSKRPGATSSGATGAPRKTDDGAAV